MEQFKITSVHEELFKRYAKLIFDNDKMFNLTGYNAVGDIYDNLIRNSVIDLSVINVPRGTKVADLGTGSGVPGLVLAILNENLQFTLLDSNGKKCTFIKETVKDLGLNNVEVVNCRIEQYSRLHRESFDLVVSRAFGPLYYSIEFGLSLLKKNGQLYVYSHKSFFDLSPQLSEFCKELGGEGAESVYPEGIRIIKKNETPAKYPRKFPIVKREAKRIPELTSF